MKRLLVVLGFGALATVGCKKDSSTGGSCDAGVTECAKPWDCPTGQTCDAASGCCIDFGCTPTSCGTCQFCDDDFTCKSVVQKCEFSPNGGCECHILGQTGEFVIASAPQFTLPAAGSVTLTAAIAEIRGPPLPGGSCVQYDWDMFPASNLFTVDPTTGVVTAAAGAARDVATVRARVRGIAASCTAQLTHLGALTVADTVRFYVLNDATGVAIAGASLVVDTDNDGLTNVVVTETATGVYEATGLPDITAYTVSVFATDYNYLSVVGLQAAAGSRDIALPLAKRPVPKTTGAFDGRPDFTPYEKRVLGGKPKTIKFGIVSGSFPLRSLLNFDFDLFVGPTTDANCSTCPGSEPICTVAGCYKIPSILGSEPTWTALPGGVLFSLATTSVKTHFDAVTAPGRRYAWGLGGEVEPSDVGALVGLIIDAACTCDKTPVCNDVPLGSCTCDGDCPGGGADLNIGELFNALTPLFGVFGSAVKGNLPLPEVDLTTWETFLASDTYTQRLANPGRLTNTNFPLLDTGGYGKLAIREPLEVFTDFALYSGYPNNANLPPDGAGGRMDTLIVVTAVNAPGYGIVPMGLGAGLDCTQANCSNPAEPLQFNGIVDGQIMCKFNSDPELNQCRPGVPTTKLDSGHLGLFHARAHGGLEGQPWVTLALALPVADLAGSGDTRAAAIIVREEPASTATPLTSDQLKRPFPAFATQPSGAANRQYTVQADQADVHWVTVATTADASGATVRWNIYFPSAGGAFTAPLPPNRSGCDNDPLTFCNDPFEPSEGGDVAVNNINATHLGFDLAALSPTLADFAANNGTILTDVIDVVVGFTLQSRDICAVGCL